MKKFLHTLFFLLGIHLGGLLLLSVFRFVKFAALHDMLSAAAEQTPVWPAFLRGLWFDNVVACYVMIVPLTLLLLPAVAGYSPRLLRRFAAIFMSVCYCILFLISAADIPYFDYFFKNIDASIFNWFGYTTATAGMIFGELSFYVYIILFLAACALFVWAVMRWHRLTDRMYFQNDTPGRPFTLRQLPACALRLLLAAACIGLCLFGIRGRRGYNPIKVSQAYYCQDAFLNQLGINPAFNLLTSSLDNMRKENRRLNLMSDREALAYVQQRLGVDSAKADPLYPLRRQVSDSLPMQRRNVVIILMESMSGALLHTLGNPEQLTPTLDSLAGRSLFFSRFYSAGIHTNIGMTAALYSMPAILSRNLMKGTVTPHRTGLPTILKEKGYTNLFFMTHEAQYDNMNAFFRTNGYDEIYSQENYPSSAVVNSFGVPDDFLFSYALPVLNRHAATGKPFMATLLTISNHPPYIIPDDQTWRTSDPETQIVEYADRCIGRFLTAARKQPWYKNTVFVIVADHGKIVGEPDAQVPQSYNHIPLFIFGPGVPTRVYDGLGTQVDLVPTLLGLLHASYTYDGMGVNLLRTSRDMVSYSADNMIAARDSSHCYLYNPATGQSFYYRQQPDGKLMITRPDGAYEKLRRHALSITQAAEYIYGLNTQIPKQHRRKFGSTNNSK